MDSLPLLAPPPDIKMLEALLRAAPRGPGPLVFERGPLALIRQGRKAGFEVPNRGAEEFYGVLLAYSEGCLARARAICKAMGIDARIKASVDDALGFSTERLADDKGRVRIAISVGEILAGGLDEEGFDFCILHELGHHERQDGWRRRLWSTAAFFCLLGTIALGAWKWNGWGEFGDAAGLAAMGLLLAAYVSTMAGLRAEESDADAFAARVLGKERALAGARQALEGAEKKESLAAKWLYRIATPLGWTHPSTSDRLASLSGE